ncbi:hypothetical protein MSG28_011933 [Choristoneura fumiferana]|uniref:Uncharacterized protein n=1 Tax=Choristoneura fumiferana TaxID=7141 RepID=A0ACC0KMB4_CHOFU|nr:hypothetical protein MSG28_011933 [Choristoneura fumiferana]
MEPLLLVAALLILAAPSYQLRMDSLDDVLVYPLEAPVKVQKRAVPKKSDSFDDFIEEKLMQHSQALEQLVRMVQQNEDVTKQLIENISLRLEKPKLPEKVEVQQPSRRFYTTDASQNNPFSRFGEKVPRYGNLMKNLMVKEYSHDSEPNVIVEQSYKPGQKLRARRAFYAHTAQ